MKLGIVTSLFLFVTIGLYGQQQIEFDIYNAINIVSLYNKTPNERIHISTKGGNIVDPNRNSMNFKYNYSFKGVEYSAGFAYSRNTYDFSVGEYTPTTIPNTYYYIFEDYKTVSLLLGIKKRWIGPSKNLSFGLGIDLLPSFLLSYSGVYSDKLVFERINTSRHNFNEIGSRLVLSIQFPEKSRIHFNFHGFVQPPSVYLSNVLKANLTNVNLGLGLGLMYEITKKND